MLMLWIARALLRGMHKKRPHTRGQEFSEHSTHTRTGVEHLLKKKRVLLIGTEPGKMIRLGRIYESLVKLGVEVKVLRPSGAPRGRPRILKGVIRYLTIMCQVLFSRADIYHFFNVPDNVGLPLLLKRGILVYDVRSPWAAVLRETFGNSPLVTVAKMIEQFMTRKADYVVCVNKILAERAAAWGAQSVAVIPNYPSENFVPGRPREDTRRKLGLDGFPVVLYLGKISKVEGIDLLMEIVREVVEAEPRIRFLVVGAGPQEERFRRFLSEERIEEKVIMTGWVLHEDVADYIEAADLCLLPRPWDTVSEFISPESVWKAGEYLALGKPVIAPKMGGFAETRYSVIAVDPSDMAATIVCFFGNPRGFSAKQYPRWSESHRRLKVLYRGLGAL